MSNKLEFERGFLGMVIETKRLKIIALTQEQLEMLVDNIPEFEKRLNCSYQGEKIEGIFKNILYEQSLKIEANSDVYLGEKASKCKTYYCRNRNRQFFLSTCFAKKRFY